MAKKTLSSDKNAILMRFFDYDFLIRFLVRPKSQKLHIFAILGVQKMVLPVPETKIRDHFYRPNTPPKPRKKHLRIAFLSLESVFLAISFILLIFPCFYSVKTP